MSSDVSAIPGADGAKDTCPRCGGQVFHAEKMLSKNNVFHKPCFSCLECKKPLDSTLCCDSPDGEIYCKGCYGRIFGPKGYGYGGVGSVPALMAPSHAPSAGNVQERIQVDFLPGTFQQSSSQFKKGCPRCGNAVYEAEKMIAAKRSWHKRCFLCGTCGRHLDSVKVNDGPDGNIYCRPCYGSKFGMRGYGFGAGAGTLTTDGAFGENIAEGAYMLP